MLGPFHPVVRDNVERLKKLSGHDEVSFHMSGTEAVMQAVRLAQFHTRRSHIVLFCGAYHGWWDGVQPGLGNRRRVNDVYTLADMSARASARARDAARHRLRARESAASAAPERDGAAGLDARRRRAPRAVRPRRVLRVATTTARRLHAARHRADLRRGLHGLSAWAAAARRSTSACAPTS